MLDAKFVGIAVKVERGTSAMGNILWVPIFAKSDDNSVIADGILLLWLYYIERSGGTAHRHSHCRSSCRCLKGNFHGTLEPPSSGVETISDVWCGTGRGYIWQKIRTKWISNVIKQWAEVVQHSAKTLGQTADRRGRVRYWTCRCTENSRHLIVSCIYKC